MTRKTKTTLLALISTLAVFGLALALSGCKKKANEAVLSILGSDGGYFYFTGKVSSSSSCGQASAVTGTGTGTGTGSGSGTGTGTGTTSYNIESYLSFDYSDAYIFTRYTWTQAQTKYNLTPSTTTVYTCTTSDGISCLTGGTRTCETADNIKCGGTKTFIFSQASQNKVFQANSGTIDWSDGFYVDPTTLIVKTSNLSVSLTDRNGSLMKADITCSN